MKNTARDAFLEIVEWNTTPSPNNQGDRIWDNRVELFFSYGEGTLLSLDSRTVYLEHICAITQRNGHGKRAMEWIIETADNEGVTILLHPCAPDREKNPDAQEKLERFYKQFGFIFTQSNLMQRTPKL